MIRRLSILVLAVLVSSCGGQVPFFEEQGLSIRGGNSFSNTRPEYYGEAFKMAYYAHTQKSIDISEWTFKVETIRTESMNAVGICRYTDREIAVDPNYWHTASDSAKRLLIFHELGHCELLRGHKNVKMDGDPLSLMYPKTFDADLYSRHQWAYDEELFSRDNSELLDAL